MNSSVSNDGVPDNATPLVHVPIGASCRVRRMDLEPSDQALLAALGVTGRSALRLCQVGNPCIVEVRGTRIGMAHAVAERLWVEPEGAQG